MGQTCGIALLLRVAVVLLVVCYLLGGFLADVYVLEDVALGHSFFGDQDHRLLWVSRHDLLADQDIRQGLEVVHELGVIVREQEIVVQPLG